MSEQKSQDQGKSGALRVRFRPVTKQTQWERRASKDQGKRPAGDAAQHKGLLSTTPPYTVAPATLESDNVRIFQEREAEYLELEEAIALLQYDLEKLQAGDPGVRVRSSHKKLQPVADAINGMAAQIDEMALSMQHISEHTARVAQVAVEAMDVTLEGQSTVDRAVDGMGQVREATMQAARVMKRLGESGQEINDTVLTITDLTTRMNLLALNAAIEAVRAGEHGQGFAVIAQEMRTLAVHSTEAARKVETRMRAIQQETATAAVSMEQNIRQVVMQTELVTQTGVALDAISVVTEQMADLVQAIAELAERASIAPLNGT